ncbi:DNA primase [Chlamydiota bacterium]
MFTKESLEKLKEKIDLLEVVSAHVEMKRLGTAHKGLCPFHQEKSPSFMIQKGDTHYHCYGCGAHGDAIQFLMEYLNLSFVDAVESLAERFHIPLERQQQGEKSTDKTALKEVCALASQYFHATLLYTEEGREALHYLFKRGLTLDFINRFEVGFAPNDGTILRKMMRAEKVPEALLIESGLLVEGGSRPFFRDRITFPIRNPTGAVIGFSARKFKEETFGGKYINTAETPLFKKSRILFGLNYCRRRIAKERRALIVEGQIDCLKLIEAGLNLTVAALGTAFGESHSDELKKLGLRTAYLLFDGDEAGQTAASKVGDLLQKRGIEVFVVNLPKGSDPDTYLTQFGTPRLIEEIERGESYLAFQVGYLGRELNLDSPAGKAELVKTLKKQVSEWEDPVMVHESLRKIASLVRVPEEMVGVRQEAFAPSFVRNRGALTLNPVDPSRVLELDLIRWLVLMGDTFLPTVKAYLTEKHFMSPACLELFQKIMKEGKTDLFTLAADVEDPSLIDEMLQKKVNRERAEAQFLETVQKLLDREWMQTREAIKMEIHSGGHPEEKVLELAKQFDSLKTHRTIVVLQK